MTAGPRLTEPCQPPIGHLLRQLTPGELMTVAAYFAGSNPRRFEEILLGTIQPQRDRQAGRQATP